jgi:hypothetical protein
MKMCGEMEVQLQTLSTAILDGSEKVSVMIYPLFPWRKRLGTIDW